MANAYYYTNNFVANTLGNPGGISNAATSFYCSVTPSALPPGYPFKLVLDNGTASEEVVKVNSGSGTVGTPFAVTRGWDGTAAASHLQGTCTVIHPATAEDFTLSRTHEQQGLSALPHGLPAGAWGAASLSIINETIVSGTSTSVVTWSSIPQTNDHLLVVVAAKSSNAGVYTSDISATINGDNGAHYGGVSWDSSNLAAGSGGLSNLSGGQYAGASNWQWFLNVLGAQAGSAVNVGGGWAIIPNYSGTTLNKMFVSTSGSGVGDNWTASTRLRWGWWNPGTQAAITTLSVAIGSGHYVSGSYLGLYAFG
jgi:hypothetical protein